MTANSRDPHSDTNLIDDLHDAPIPSHSGASGGAMQRAIGARDDGATATGANPQPTSIRKGDKSNDGDEPNLPSREGGGTADRAPPKRTS